MHWSPNGTVRTMTVRIYPLENTALAVMWLASLKVKLMPNPLANDKRSTVDLGIGLDKDGSYLKTTDELPLFTVSETPNLVRGFITKKSEKSVDVWQNDSAAVRQLRVSNVDKMMAFDCGEFELK